MSNSHVSARKNIATCDVIYRHTSYLHLISITLDIIEMSCCAVIMCNYYVSIKIAIYVQKEMGTGLS